MSEKWYRKLGEQHDMVISTRIRLARNLSGYPFPNRMTDQQNEEVKRAVCEAVNQIGGLQLQYFEMRNLHEHDVLALIERHLVSSDFAKRSSGALLLSEDERISIMINEEDHIRIQVMSAGLDLEGAYELANLVETALDERLHFAFDDRLGYLTQCPTNLGTGMRASLMMHLPALQECGAIRQLSNNVSKLGLTIRGTYGEGSQPYGAFYQMSNQVTLGISEQSAMENLKSIALQIMKQEMHTREQCMADDKYIDRIWRSYGILSTARLISNDEALKLLSNVRLGVCFGILQGITLESIAVLISEIHPGCIMSHHQEELSADARDKLRAELIREVFC